MFDADDPIVPIADAAEFLGLGKQTLYNYRYRKTGPASESYDEDVGFRQGSKKRIGYRQSVLDAWLDQRNAKKAATAAKKKPKKRKKGQKKNG